MEATSQPRGCLPEIIGEGMVEQAITRVTTATITRTCSVAGIIFTRNNSNTITTFSNINNGEISRSICIPDIIDLSETKQRDSVLPSGRKSLFQS
eukprot:TCALIF_07625-PA protein Name:"Protein of unknown function" AED:0.25 eAED:0.25 QI:126/0/0.5/0.5/1/1/2/100/94